MKFLAVETQSGLHFYFARCCQSSLYRDLTTKLHFHQGCVRCSSSLQSFLGQGVNHIAKCLLAGYARSCIWSWVWTYICLVLRGLNISLKLVEPLCFLVFELSLHVLASCVCMLAECYFLTDL